MQHVEQTAADLEARIVLAEQDELEAKEAWKRRKSELRVLRKAMKALNGTSTVPSARTTGT